MSRLRVALLVLLGSIGTAVPRGARAELQEAAVGITGGALFPAIKPPTTTAPLLVTWVVGVEGLYGVTDDLSVRGAFSASRLHGRIDDWRLPGTAYSGSYLFEGAYYHPEIGLRYKAYAGYDLAPHLEAGVGYLWAVYDHGILKTSDASVVRVKDEGSGHVTVSGGLALDYRLANRALVGVAARYTWTVGGLSSGFISVPLYVSYFW